MSFSFVIVDDLTKVYPSKVPAERSELPLFGPLGGNAAFQLAYSFARAQRTPHWPSIKVTLKAPGANLLAQQVRVVPALCPSWRQDLADYEVDGPALIPDLLIPLASGEDEISFVTKPTGSGFSSIWFEVGLTASEVSLLVEDDKGEMLFSKTLPIESYSALLSKAPVTHARWFHYDSLAEYYGLEMWSERHWEAIKGQFEAAADLGVTSLMIPAWTPPLDVKPGDYRHRAQLIGITKENGGFKLDLSKVEKWVEVARAAGIRQVELPQFFTQWGAGFAAGIYLTDQTADEQPYFGWHTSATDPEYAALLTQLITELRSLLEPIYGVENIFWHVSDEPHAEHLAEYQAAAGQVRPLLAGAEVIDALSDPEYLKEVPTPVVATSEVDKFRAVGVEPSWVYYCVSQSLGQANQLLAQNGVRHAIQGFQFYKHQVKGFLHWGLNFYYRQYSQGLVDPVNDTDAGGNFLSGDPFIIYPGTDLKPWLSLRHRMIRSAWQDLALLYALEDKVGRDALLQIIDPDGSMDYAAGFPTNEELAKRRYQLFKLAQEHLN
ncbi:DUF4091 domain-containing protein [Boudabousia tangfeifanii]|uniref:DUF4091 domain-containing protein n=1 Tax=Boudabousia tangfeifanii TaxID=1912795 RepID=UPI0009F3DF74|nr:DUF4091 domain-containing protein [Boudabousia tangfeifanii]